MWEALECAFQAQKGRIAESDLVLLPTVYVTLPVPKELKEVAALVIDESVVGHFERTATLDPSVFKILRQQARLTQAQKAEAEKAWPYRKREEAWDDKQNELMNDRDEVGEVAAECIRTGRDVALHLMTYRSTSGHASGYQLAQTALSVCGLASDVHELVTADIDLFRAKELASRKRDLGLLPEIRFWRLVVERLDMLRADAAAAEKHHVKRLNCRRLQLPEWFYDENPPVVTARGDRDYRLRVLTDGETGKKTVSMSWRPKNRFGQLPTLLLDASADEAMLTKIWNGREVVPVEAPAPLHLRTLWLPDRPVSLRSRLPYKCTDLGGQAGAARTLAETREVIEGMSVVFAHSRLLVSAPKQLEVALQSGWKKPPNVDFVHDGATVGLDFARYHAAVLVIGQTDIPIQALDARVACWTYDDPVPEEPVDRLGTGCDAEGNEVYCPSAEVVTPMRDGRDVTTLMRRHPVGTWAWRVQQQTREEPMRQAIGRTRPVYRLHGDVAPIAIIWGQTIPAGIVVDELSTGDGVRTAVAHLSEAFRVGALPHRIDHRDTGMPVTDKWDALQKVIETLYVDEELGQTMGLSRYLYTRPSGHEIVVRVPAYADPVDVITKLERASRSGRPFDPSKLVVIPHPDNKPVRHALPRPEDPKMTRLLGTPEDIEAAAVATLALVREMDDARAWPREVFDRRLSPEARGILLTVRPRTDADPANKLATLRNPDVFPLPTKPAPAPPVVPPAAPVIHPGVVANDAPTIGEVWAAMDEGPLPIFG